MGSPGIFERPRDARQRCDVKHDVHAGDGTATDIDVAQVAAQELDVARDVGEIGFVAGTEIVDHANLVSEGHEPFGEMGADEPGTPGNQAV